MDSTPKKTTLPHLFYLQGTLGFSANLEVVKALIESVKLVVDTIYITPCKNSTTALLVYAALVNETTILEKVERIKMLTDKAVLTSLEFTDKTRNLATTKRTFNDHLTQYKQPITFVSPPTPNTVVNKLREHKDVVTPEDTTKLIDEKLLKHSDEFQSAIECSQSVEEVEKKSNDIEEVEKKPRRKEPKQPKQGGGSKVVSDVQGVTEEPNNTAALVAPVVLGTPLLDTFEMIDKPPLPSGVSSSGLMNLSGDFELHKPPSLILNQAMAMEQQSAFVTYMDVKLSGLFKLHGEVAKMQVNRTLVSIDSTFSKQSNAALAWSIFDVLCVRYNQYTVETLTLFDYVKLHDLMQYTLENLNNYTHLEKLKSCTDYVKSPYFNPTGVTFANAVEFEAALDVYMSEVYWSIKFKPNTLDGIRSSVSEVEAWKQLNVLLANSRPKDAELGDMTVDPNVATENERRIHNDMNHVAVKSSGGGCAIM